MKVSFSNEVTLDLLKSFREIDDLSDKLEEHFRDKSYTNLKSVIVCFHCLSPKYFPNADQYHTGYVLKKKYIKSKKHLEYTVRIKFDEIQDQHSLKPSVINALKGSIEGVNELAIPNFDMSELVSDMLSVIGSGVQSTVDSINEVVGDNTHEEKEEVSFVPLMDLDAFWTLIEESNKEESVKGSVEYLVNQVSKLALEQQYGFELRLRDVLEKSNHYNVLGLAKAILGMVSDDSFLYFRCRLILLGRKLYNQAINTPDSWDMIVNDKFGGEDLLSASDKAFYLVNGKKTHEESPKDYALDFLDYDIEHEMKGEPWEQRDFMTTFPNLWRQFSNVN